jgi:choline dehydrogenase
MTYDYVIVGAGAAGCVLANRLSADPATQVLLIEYGGADRHPLIRMPKGFYFLVGNPKYFYQYPTNPLVGTGAVETWGRGKVIGGSTTINGLIWTRGWAADYDAIEAAGNSGWGWADMLRVFREIEDHQLGASEARGAGGPVRISIAEGSDELADAIIRSAGKLGWQHAHDTNDGDAERIGYTPGNIRNGRRVGAADAFLKPVLKRPNLTYLDRARATEVLFEGRRAVGVRVERGTVQDFHARKEVLLSAGAIESPMLLERSGIGEPGVLAAAGVNARVESPNVGERLLEHRSASLQYKLRVEAGQNRLLNSPVKQVLAGARYLVTRRGPIATPGYDLASFFKSSEEVERPDLFGIFSPLSLDLTAQSLKVAKDPGLMFLGYLLRPTTRSSIHIRSADPAQPPAIDARFLETDVDKRSMSKLLARGRAVLAQSPVADMILEEEAPGPGVSSPDEVVDHALKTGAGIAHAVGSCAMGPNDSDVLDARLFVRGTEALRVVDASAFPAMPAGTTAAPVMALAWRAAELIREDAC